jgi:hypothetical protein
LKVMFDRAEQYVAISGHIVYRLATVDQFELKFHGFSTNKAATV